MYRCALVVPDLLWVELKLVRFDVIGLWTWCSLCFSVFDYTYLLFWNSFWTIAPVIAIGLFDRLVGTLDILTFLIWVLIHTS